MMGTHAASSGLKTLALQPPTYARATRDFATLAHSGEQTPSNLGSGCDSQIDRLPGVHWRTAVNIEL